MPQRAARDELMEQRSSWSVSCSQQPSKSVCNFIISLNIRAGGETALRQRVERNNLDEAESSIGRLVRSSPENGCSLCEYFHLDIVRRPSKMARFSLLREWLILESIRISVPVSPFVLYVRVVLFQFYLIGGVLLTTLAVCVLATLIWWYTSYTSIRSIC